MQFQGPENISCTSHKQAWRLWNRGRRLKAKGKTWMQLQFHLGLPDQGEPRFQVLRGFTGQPF